MNSNLPASIVSSQDLTLVIREIQDYTAWATHETIKYKTGVKKPMTDQPPLTPAATAIVSNWGRSKGATADSYRQLIETLERIARSAPSITITLAGPPPQKVKESIVKWCRENLSSNVFVTFRFNRTLLGGMVVRAGSRVYDWSLHRKLMEHGRQFTEVYIISDSAIG